MQVVKSEKSDIVMMKNVQNPPKTVVMLLVHETCAVQHMFYKKECAVYSVQYLHVHMLFNFHL